VPARQRGGKKKNPIRVRFRLASKLAREWGNGEERGTSLARALHGENTTLGAKEGGKTLKLPVSRKPGLRRNTSMLSAETQELRGWKYEGGPFFTPDGAATAAFNDNHRKKQKSEQTESDVEEETRRPSLGEGPNTASR